MKKYLMSFIMLITLGSAFAQTEIYTHAQLDAVTLYQNSAQLQERFSVQLPAGKSRVIVKDVSQYIQQEGIKILAKQKVDVLNFYLERSKTLWQHKHPLLLKIQDSLDDFNNKIIYLNADITGLQEEKSLLINNRKLSGENQSVSIAQLKEASAFFRQRIAGITKETHDINLKIKALQKERTKVQLRYNEISNSKIHTNQTLVIDVFTETAQKVDLGVDYLVNQARWNPFYVFRAQNVDGPIDVELKSNVFNQTDKNWNNVRLVLTTLQARRFIQQPNPQPWIISFYQPVTMQNRLYGKDRQDENKATFESADLESMPHRKPMMIAGTTSGATVTQNDISYTFTINKRQHIPSSSTAHIVGLERLDQKADFSYYAAPKLDPNTYLLAKITGFEENLKVAGEVQIYFDNNYVGKTHFNPMAAEDTLDISFGVDPNIAISRVKNHKNKKRNVIGFQQTETHEYEISIKNNHKKAVKIKVVDQIPLANDPSINVELIESSGGKLEKKTGFVNWELTLEAGESKKLLFSFQVKYPKDKKLNIQQPVYYR